MPSLTEDQKWKLGDTLVGLMNRTLLSDLLPPSIKHQRAIICAKAIDPVHIPEAFYGLVVILSGGRYSGSLATRILQIVKGWRIGRDEDTVLCAQTIISTIVASAQPRDDSWYILASNELGLPEAVLRDYTVHGDSQSLAILIHATRQQFAHFKKSSWPDHKFRFVLAAASKFDVQDTSPELQHEFCALWNQIVRKAQNDNNRQIAFHTLAPISKVYIALHQGTDSAPTQFSTFTIHYDDIMSDPSSYPVCNVPGHHPDSTPGAHDDSASTPFVRAVPHGDDSTAPVPSFLSRSPDTASMFAHVPLRVDESVTDALPLDDDISFPVQTNPASHRIISTSPNPVTIRATHGTLDTSPRKMSPSALEPSVSPLPTMLKASTPPSDVVIIEHTAVSHTAPDDPNVPPLGAITEDDDSTKAVLRGEKEVVPYPSWAIHNDTMVSADVPSQFPPPQPIPDIVSAAGPSCSSLDAENTREPSPQGQYDIM